MTTIATPIIEEKKDVTVLNNPTVEISIEKIGVKAGLVTGLSLIIYFMIMKYFNVLDSGIAWGFNFIILWAGINLAYRYYRSKTKLNVDYFPGLILGGVTTLAAVIPYVIFEFIYFSQMGAALLPILKNSNLFMGDQVTPVKAVGSTMLEGICSGLIISFMMMQYFKSGFRRKRNEKVIPG